MNFFDNISMKIKATRWMNEFREVENLIKSHEYNESLEILNKILKFESATEIKMVAFLYKGFALYSLNKYYEAIDNIDEVIKITSEFELAYQVKADALRHLGKYEEAIDCYNKILKNEPNEIYALMNKAFCLGTLGKFHETINTINVILEIEPGNIKAIDSKKFALDCLEKKGDYTYKNENLIIKIVTSKIPNSNTLLLGEQKKDSNWDIYMVDPQSKSKEVFKTDIPTEKLELFLNLISNKL